MTPVLFILMLVGIGYVSWLLTRFIVWLDGAEVCEESAAKAEERKDVDAAEERCDAA